MSNPRFTIDGRAASDFPSRGLLIADLIEGLEHQPDDYQLLCHNNQFDALNPMLQTEKRIGSFPLYSVWEKKFLQNSKIERLHRFRPADYLNPVSCKVLTTVLPPVGKLPSQIRSGDQEHLLVPSLSDAVLLEERGARHIERLLPVTRHISSTHTRSQTMDHGQILVVLGNSRYLPTQTKLFSFIRKCFASYPIQTVDMDKPFDFSLSNWTAILEETRLCFYLSATPFDWGTLALEAIGRDVPTVFCDGHGALNELMPNSQLKLSQFLLHPLDWNKLQQTTRSERDMLMTRGVFNPRTLIEQYQKVYETRLLSE